MMSLIPDISQRLRSLCVDRPRRRTTIMDAFTELGMRVAREWGKHRYETDALPNIAANELARAPLHRIVDYRSILNWIGSADMIPFQMNIEASFGEPPLTVFWHPNFYIEALFWASSTTTVHGHGFVGAFQVLAGTSLQSLFEFEARGPKNGRCRVGRLQQTEAALLRTGATQMINGGEQFIHSVFHLGYPSVTIVVRTYGRSVGTQYDYRRPGVALPYRYESTFDHLTNRLLQVARLQAILKSDDLGTTVAKIGRQCDLAACFKLLETVQPILYGQQRLDVAGEVIATLAGTAGLKHVTELAAALTLEQTLNRVRKARDIVVEEDLRLFLALLLTQQEWAFVMPLVTDYTGIAEPSGTIASWIRELGRRNILNVPTDEQTQKLLTAWVAYGSNVALKEARAAGYGDDGARTLEQLEAEPLLAPLLRSDTAAAWPSPRA
jgi:hypothetical protein